MWHFITTPSKQGLNHYIYTYTYINILSNKIKQNVFREDFVNIFSKWIIENIYFRTKIHQKNATFLHNFQMLYIVYLLRYSDCVIFKYMYCVTHQIWHSHCFKLPCLSFSRGRLNRYAERQWKPELHMWASSPNTSSLRSEEPGNDIFHTSHSTDVKHVNGGNVKNNMLWCECVKIHIHTDYIYIVS